MNDCGRVLIRISVPQEDVLAAGYVALVARARADAFGGKYSLDLPIERYV